MRDCEKEIIEYLEDCYTGARAIDDIILMVRIQRAIAAFNSNPEDAPNTVFAPGFICRYERGGV